MAVHSSVHARFGNAQRVENEVDLSFPGSGPVGVEDVLALLGQAQAYVSQEGEPPRLWTVPDLGNAQRFTVRITAGERWIEFHLDPAIISADVLMEARKQFPGA